VIDPRISQESHKGESRSLVTDRSLRIGLFQRVDGVVVSVPCVHGLVCELPRDG